MSADRLLANLNQSQHTAVSSFADQLAILAGPGSGKTHTLTSRTAWLLAQGFQPWNVIVATFTVKAAREMKERIGKLLGNGLESKLILGTFHSIARRYLARYGHLIEIKKDFGIADSADSLAIIKRIVKRNNFNIDPKVARSRISGKKARGAEKVESKSGAKSVDNQEFETCYTEYEDALKRSNLLDYDDLLLRCVDLLRNHPSCVSNVEAVLIDEFQDTNIVQFDLMRLFAAQRKRITIVGDPDQSIYGFRAAETKNYKRMLRQYPGTVTIALEENYRSSGAILLTALSVIEQDTSRVKKSLLPTHTVGTRPVLRQLSNAHKEAEWIITEIQRVLGLSGELMDLNDIAILLRSAALSRLIESALGKAGIAYRMVGGLRFYDRVEVKTILDYLRVINQPDNNDALSRIINTPSRRIGEATVKALLEEADQAKITLWCLILGVAQGNRTARTKLPKQTDQGLSRFVNLILTARSKLAGTSEEKEKLPILDLIKFIVQKTDYETWLEEHHNDEHKARWANVEELMTQAFDFQELIAVGYEDDFLPEVEGLEQGDDSDPLSKFLANVALASEVKNEETEGVPKAQVTISTIHAAKGLEWPVVFVPAAYQGSIPHSRAEDEDEERRLLYVAMTRAKALLYLSCPIKSSQGEKTALSPFLTPSSLKPLLDQRGPALGSSVVQTISQILRRPLPSAASIYQSSVTLPSANDDLFAVDDGDEEKELEARFNSASGNPKFTMGQQPAKRRRIELGRSISNQEERLEKDWKPSNSTTMDRVSSFSAASVTLPPGFVSAGSHLEVLREQSANCIAGALQEKRISAKTKSTSKSKSKASEGQGTLLGFLGKREASPEKVMFPAGSSESSTSHHTSASVVIPGRDINRARMARFDSAGTPAIEPLLATHRVGPSIGNRPRTTITKEEHKRNDYIFLSSSPPRPQLPRLPEPTPEKPPGLTSNPPLLAIIRPPLSMYNTTMNKVQQGKKTLGVKRSMNGWPPPSQKGFVPPTLKKSA